jgi:hypothetical protein
MKGSLEYIILTYLYQFYDFYRAVTIPDTLRSLNEWDHSADSFSNILDTLIEKGLVDHSGDDFFIITMAGVRQVEAWQLENRQKEEEEYLRNLRWWFPGRDPQALFRDYPQTKKKVDRAFWMALAAVILSFSMFVMMLLSR